MSSSFSKASAKQGHPAPAGLETQARKAAQHSPLETAPLSATPANLAATAPALAGGRSLTRNETGALPPALKKGASSVRVHDDAQGAQAAESKSARAFAHGSHIAFGAGEYHPGSSAGDALLAHEVAHTMQQQGGPAIVQKDDKAQDKPKAPTHLGDKPPAVPFQLSTAKGKASEDDHFLFEQDHAELPAGAQKALQALVAKNQGTLNIEITGYASTEGDANYNVNLAAHRAAAVQAALAPFLPPGANVTLFSRGETDAFGVARENRRAGIQVFRVVQITPEARENMLKPGKLSFGGGAGAANVIGGAGPHLTLDPNLAPPDLSPKAALQRIYSSTGPVSLDDLPPLLVPPEGVDWRAMSEPLYLRGMRITSSDYTAIEANWTRTYSLLLWFGRDPKSARSLSNTLTASMLDHFAAGEQPSLLDQAQHERDVTHTQTIPMIPIVGVTEFILSKIKGKDVDIHHF